MTNFVWKIDIVSVTERLEETGQRPVDEALAEGSESVQSQDLLHEVVTQQINDAVSKAAEMGVSPSGMLKMRLAPPPPGLSSKS